MRRVPVLFLVLASCISYTPKPIDPAANALSLDSRRLDDPALHAYVEQSLGHAIAQWPPTTWDLDTLTAAAFYFNPDIAVARAHHATALAAITTARQRPNPGGTASLEHKAPTSEQKPWVSSFGFDFPLELPAKRRARVDQAIASAEAVRSRVSLAGWEVRSRLRQHVLDIRASAQRQDTLKRQLDVQRDIVEIFTKRFELGESAQPELARARVALAQTQLLIEDNRRLAGEARAGIASSLGVPLKALASSSTDNGGIVVDRPSIDDSLRDVALTGRADVLAAIHEYAAEEAALRLEIARQYPDLHLAPAFGWDQAARTWALAAAAELPLFSRHRGEINEAIARRDEAAARFNAVQAAVISAFDLARTQFTAARAKLELADALVQSVETQVTAARKQFEAGEIDRLALRSAELEREAVVLARVDAAIDVQRALGGVEDALQRPIGSTMPRLEEKR